MSDKIERIIDALRKKILESAIRGELVPQNPEDEPASKLLERIAKERERLIREKKIKKPRSTSRIFRRDRHFYESINSDKPTCIDDELPFAIPDSWEWVRAGAIFDIWSAKRVLQSDWQTSGIPFFRAREIAKLAEFGKVKNELYISEELFHRLSIGGLPHTGDLMITAVGTIGKVYIVKQDDRFYFKDASVISFRNYGRLNSDFFKKLLESDSVQEQMYNKSSGTTVDTITIAKANEYLLPIPPLQEQHRIVNLLNRENEKLNILQQSRKRYKRILSETPTSLRQQLIQDAIQGQLVPQDPSDEPASVLLERIAQERTAKLGKKAAKSMSRIERRGSRTCEIFPDGSEKDITNDIPFELPEYWAWCRLSYISYGLQYGTSQKSNLTGKYAVLRMGNIRNGEIDFSDLVYSNNEEDFSKLELKNGDVLFNRTNSPEWVGKTAIFRNHKTPCIFAGYLIRINQCEQIDGDYLNYFLNSSSARKQGDGVVSLAVNQANISGRKLSDYFIPIPPLQEQHRIVEKLDALLKLV